MGLFNLFKKEVPQAQPVSAPDPKEPEPEITEKNYKVAGISYREKEIIGNKELFCKSPLYSCSKNELIDDGITNCKCYQYEALDCIDVRIEPEPDNPEDPKAMAIYFNDVKVGYIKAAKASEVRNILARQDVQEVIGHIAYGKYKIVREDYDYDKDREIYTLDKGEDVLHAKITIRYYKK